MEILRPSFSWYCSGVSHIQIPIVSGSWRWPSLKHGWLSRSESISWLSIYDFPVRHGPTRAITQTGSVISSRIAMAFLFVMRFLRLTPSFFLQWFFCLSNSQSSGRHRGIAFPLAASKTFRLVALTVCVISSLSWSLVSLPVFFFCGFFLIKHRHVYSILYHYY